MIKHWLKSIRLSSFFKISARGRLRKDLNEEQRNWLIVFLPPFDISDITYTKIIFSLVKRMVNSAANNTCVCSGMHETFSISLTVQVKLIFIVSFIKPLIDY